MIRRLQLVAAPLLLTAAAMSAQIHLQPDKPAAEDLSWMWQYTQPAPDGNENGLASDPRFRELLNKHLTAPQSFWNKGREKLADVAVEFLSVPGIARADDNRYLTATGCVPHFCPSRGMLFIDIGSSHPLVVFAAIDWTRDSHNIEEDDAEFTLWLFPDRALATAGSDNTPRLSSPLKRSLGIFSAERNGGKVSPLITRAFVIDPSGMPHEIPASQTGVTRFHDSQPLAVPAA